MGIRATMSIFRGQAVSFEGDTLVLPSVSCGNVGQLTADLLICSLSAERVGIMSTHAVAPMVGMGAFKNGVLSTAIEVFRAPEYQITIVQQRSPLHQGKGDAFVEEMAAGILSAGFTKTFVLSSADASCRNDLQLMSGQLQFLANSAAQPFVESLTHSGFCSLVESSHGEQEVFVPTRSFSRLLLAACEGHPMSVLLSLCYEGDNVPQSLQLGASVAAALKLNEKGVTALKMPQSWEHIQGAPFPTDELF